MGEDDAARETVICAIHGVREATIVCVHIIDSLHMAKPVGFQWHVDTDGNFQAVCDDCKRMDEEAWAANASKLGRVLCVDCYREAAEMNGVLIRRVQQ